MFRDLPRYDRYAPNSSPWLGDLPWHWSTQRTKSLLVERSQKGFPDEPLLASTQSHGVILKSDYATRTVTATKDLHLLKLVEVGDFVISLRSFQGGIERCHHRGIISPAYTVLTAESDEYRDYLTYLFKSKPFVDSLTLSVTGIREGQNIDYATLSVDLLPVPPVDEQVAIVKYLAHANARIDKAIAAKRRLIALLEEQRRGIAMASLSTVSWSRERLGFHVNLLTGFPYKSEDFRQVIGSQTTPLLRGVNVGVGEIVWDDVVAVDSGLAEGTELFKLQSGDLVLGMDRPLIKGGVRVAEVTSDSAGSLLVQRVARIRPKRNLDPHYLALVMSSGEFARYLKPIFTGISVPHLSPKQIRDFRIPMGSLSEQKSLVDLVLKDSAEILLAIAKTRREIALLQEFRTRLVADVVTGQVDVRAVAATLPDEPEVVTDFAAASDEIAPLDEELTDMAEGDDE